MSFIGCHGYETWTKENPFPTSLQTSILIIEPQYKLLYRVPGHVKSSQTNIIKRYVLHIELICLLPARAVWHSHFMAVYKVIFQGFLLGDSQQNIQQHNSNSKLGWTQRPLSSLCLHSSVLKGQTGRGNLQALNTIWMLCSAVIFVVSLSLTRKLFHHWQCRWVKVFFSVLFLLTIKPAPLVWCVSISVFCGSLWKRAATFEPKTGLEPVRNGAVHSYH